MRNHYDGEKGAYKALLKDGTSGFAALLGGYRTPSGAFYGLGMYGGYWSGTEKDAQDAWRYHFDRLDGELSRDDYDKAWGLSCRCLQD